MMVRTVEGKRLWSFTVDEKLLYEMVCNITAWKAYSQTQKPKDEVMELTVKLVGMSPAKSSEEDLKKINDVFIRAVFQERKRLGLTKYQLKGEEK